MKVKYCILACLLIITAQSSFAQKQPLRLNLIVGDTYYHSMASTSLLTQKYQGSESVIEMIIKGKVAFTVTEKTDSLYSMDVMYQNLSMATRVGSKCETYNSDTPENDLMSEMLSKMIGKKFYIKMTSSGKISEVRGVDALFDGMVDDSDPQVKMIVEEVKKSYGEESFIGSYEMFSNIYPVEPVSVGGTWLKNTTLKSSVNFSVATVFKFDSANSTYHIFSGKGVVSSPNKNEYKPLNGSFAKYNLNGTINAVFKTDSKTGWIISVSMVQNIQGYTEIKKSLSSVDILKITMAIKSKVNCTGD